MPIGSKTSAFMSQLVAGPGVQETIQGKGIKQFRQDTENFFDLHAMPLAGGIHVTEGVIKSPHGHDIAIKVYKPEGVDAGNDLPLLIFFPGGASVLDLKRAYDGPCSEMAKKMNGVVIKVSCRLAPEYHRLQAFDDAYVATQYLYEYAASFGGSQNHFIVGGNSSGAHLAALVVNKIKKNQRINIAAQLLITPSVDMSLELRKSTQFKSYQDKDFLLSIADQEYYTKISMPKNIDPKDPSISPYYDDLRGVPPTVVIFGEYDALRGDAEAYIEKLKDAGVKLAVHRIPGQVHSAMILYQLLKDGPNQATIAGEALATLCNCKN